VARMRASPSAEAVAWTGSPAQMPRLVKKAARLPSSRVTFATSAMSAPGRIVSSAAIPMNATIEPSSVTPSSPGRRFSRTQGCAARRRRTLSCAPRTFGRRTNACAGIRLEVVLDLRGRQCAVECGDVRRRDARVVAAKETEYGCAHAPRLLRRGWPDIVLALAEPAIETHNTREARLFGRGQEGDAPAKAETKDESAASLGLSFEVRAACRDVRKDTLRGRLPHMWHVVEVIRAPFSPRRAPEIVEGDRVDACR